MKFPTIKPAQVQEIGAAMGVPAGKPASIKNMARGARKRRPKPGVNPGTGQSYA
jgi:hypothetical protein